MGASMIMVAINILVTILNMLSPGMSLMKMPMFSLTFFFNDTPPTEIYTLSLHDALPICLPRHVAGDRQRRGGDGVATGRPEHGDLAGALAQGKQLGRELVELGRRRRLGKLRLRRCGDGSWRDGNGRRGNGRSEE